jgi:hypothetical protein
MTAEIAWHYLRHAYDPTHEVAAFVALFELALEEAKTINP